MNIKHLIDPQAPRSTFPITYTMGLDTSHNCWHGSYGGFNIFRTAIATAAGHDFDGHYGKRCSNHSISGKWGTRKAPDDILEVLLCHADHTGVIPARFCNALADGLQAIHDKLPAEGEDDWIAKRNLQFIAGLRDAAAKNEDVTFA